MRGKESYIEGWLGKAALDLETYQLVMVAGTPHVDSIAAFHAQQATEKWLKALLIKHDIIPPRTHSLRHLLDYLDEFYIELQDAVWIERARTLTEFAVEIR